MPGDGGYANTSQLVIRNTFIEFEEKKEVPLRRCNSGSDLSSPSNVASLEELKAWSEATSQTGSGRSNGGSGRNTPQNDQSNEDEFDEDDTEDLKWDELDLGNWVPSQPSLDAMELYNKLQSLAQGRSLPDKILADLTRDGSATEHIPQNPNSEPSSIGSIPHGQPPVATNCRPCLFFLKNRCIKGQFCLHCHLPHPSFKAKRLRASKATRQRRAKMWQNTGDTPPSSGRGGSGGSMGSSGSSQGHVIGCSSGSSQGSGRLNSKAGGSGTGGQGSAKGEIVVGTKISL